MSHADTRGRAFQCGEHGSELPGAREREAGEKGVVEGIVRTGKRRLDGACGPCKGRWVLLHAEEWHLTRLHQGLWGQGGGRRSRHGQKWSRLRPGRVPRGAAVGFWSGVGSAASEPVEGRGAGCERGVEGPPGSQA